MEFKDDELNYFRLCNIATRIIPEGLREIFKQQWDALYASTYGKWIDKPANYKSFYNMESRKNRIKHKRLLGLMTNGNRNDWDSTCLSYAILFSDCVGPKLHSTVKSSVDALRESRNEVAHNAEGRVTDVDFQSSIQKILTAFTTLNLDVTDLEELKNQSCFPTKERNNTNKELERIKQELEDEKKRNAEPNSFCVLPPKSCHDLVDRYLEVERISEKMKQLSDDHKGETTTVYLTGNPGCGKSVLAGQIGDKYIHSDAIAHPSFVMTINVSNLDTLLQSYVEFARRLKCDPNSLTKITTSKDLSQEEQILQLKALIAPQVDKYASWLMIIDNTIDLKSFSKCWPQFSEITSGVGQILITTQDERSIANNSHTEHISLKKGMTEDRDAIDVLSKVSGVIEDDDEILLKVAKTLDFQPLALASAGVYMKKARRTTTWQTYLEKLEARGRKMREATEKVYEKSNLSYPMSMTVAVKMALQKEISDNKIMFHAFEFLSAIANDPIAIEYIVDYVINCMPQEDEEVVASTIASSSLLMLSDDGNDISMHQIVYHCLLEGDHIECEDVDMFAVMSTFTGLLQSFDRNTVEDIIKTRAFLDHFAVLLKKLTCYLVQSQKACKTDLSYHLDVLVDNLSNMGNICVIHGKFKIAKHCFQLCLSMQLPSFLKEMEELFIKSDSSKSAQPDPLSQGKMKVVLNMAMGVYKDTIPSHDAPVCMSSFVCYQGSYKEDGKRKTAEILTILGMILSNLCQFYNAKVCHEVALAIYELECENYYPKLEAETLRYLSETLDAIGEKDNAKKCHQRALTLFKHEVEIANSWPMSRCKEYDKAGTYYGLGISMYKCSFGFDHEHYLYESIKNLTKALEKYESFCGKDHPKVANILNKLGRIYFRLRDHNSAQAHFDKALSIYTGVYDENHPLVGATNNNLGKALFALCLYESALTYFKRSLKIFKSAYGESHLLVGELQANIGQTLYMQECFDEAKTYYDNALTTDYGKDCPSLGEVIFKLGNAFHNVEQFDEAKTCYDNALVTGYAYVGEVMFKLGDIFYHLKRFDEAKTYYDKGIINGYGNDCPSVGEAIFNLGNTFYHLKQFDKAKTCYDNALNTGYGKSCTSICEAIFKLGDAFYDVEQFDKAKTCFKNALDIFNSEHPLEINALLEPVESLYFDLGEAFYNLGQFPEAKTCFEKALNRFKCCHDNHHPSIGASLYSLGKTLYALEEYVEAKTVLEQSLSTGYGNNHPKLLICAGDTLSQLGQYNKAIECYKLSVSKYDEYRLYVAVTLLQIGETLYERRQFKEAKASFENCLSTFKPEYGENHPTVSKTLYKLGKTLYKMEEYTEAKKAFEQAIFGGYGEGHPKVFVFLGDTLYKLEQYNEAIECYTLYVSKHDEYRLYVAANMLQIGETLYERRQFKQAKACFENCISTFKAEYDDNHPAVSNTLYKLGKTLYKMEEYSEAKKAFEQAIVGGYGEGHPEVFVFLGDTLYKLGQYAKAKFYYENALSAGYNEDCSTFGTSLFNLGDRFYNLGQFDESKTCFEHALDVCRLLHEEKNLVVCDTLKKLCYTFNKLRQDETAVPYYEEAIAMSENIYGENHPTVGDLYTNLGLTLKKLGQNTLAKTCFKKAEQMLLQQETSSKPYSLKKNGLDGVKK